MEVLEGLEVKMETKHKISMLLVEVTFLVLELTDCFLDFDLKKVFQKFFQYI